MTLESIEMQIVTEYGVVIGTIKNNAVLYTIVALVAGFVLGRLGFPWII